MRKSIRNLILASATGLLFYLPAAQATGFYFSQRAPQHLANGHQGFVIGGGRGLNNHNNRGWRGQGFGHNPHVNKHQRRFNRGRGFNRGFNGRSNGQFNRGRQHGLHGFDRNGYYQKRRHIYRDQFGRSHFYYR